MRGGLGRHRPAGRLSVSGELRAQLTEERRAWLTRIRVEPPLLSSCAIPAGRRPAHRWCCRGEPAAELLIARLACSRVGGVSVVLVRSARGWRSCEPGPGLLDHCDLPSSRPPLVYGERIAPASRRRAPERRPSRRSHRPGIIVGEAAERLKTSRQMLYSVTARLRREGRLRKLGCGLYPAEQPAAKRRSAEGAVPVNTRISLRVGRNGHVRDRAPAGASRRDLPCAGVRTLYSPALLR